jgi:hypothetical protein
MGLASLCQVVVKIHDSGDACPMSTPLRTQNELVILHEPLVAKVLDFVASQEPIPSRRIRALVRAVEVARVHWYSEHAESANPAGMDASEARVGGEAPPQT